MSTLYCDHGAYGAYAAAPTWGNAQDGDGTAKTLGTPSTAEVVFTGIASTGVIAVLGQTITFTRVTDANTCANNLATAINASTANATGPASFTTLSQVRNHLFARGPATGAPAGTCQIMTRQASVAHAGLIAITHTLNNVSSPATINFAGGAGGVWGYFISNTNLWPQGVAVAGYGMLCAVGFYTGAHAPGDVVHVRSNKTLTMPTSPGYTATMRAMGTTAAPVLFAIDDGTQWPADGSAPVFTVTQSMGAGVASLHSAAETAHAIIKAKKYASGLRSLVFELTGVGSGIISLRLLSSGSAIRYENIDYIGYGQNFPALYLSSGYAIVTVVTSYVGCRFVWPTQLASASYASAINGGVTELDGCEFVQAAPTSAQTFGVFAPQVSGSTGRLVVRNSKFTGFVSGSMLIPVPTGWTDGYEISFPNCDLGNVTRRGPYLSIVDAGLHRLRTMSSGYNTSGQKDFFMDVAQGFCEWNSSRGYPKLNARLLDGVTPWVIYAIPSNRASNISRADPFELPPIGKLNTLATAARTVTVRILLESTLSWTRADISVALSYAGAGGALEYINTFDVAGAALASSNAVWTSTSFNGQTWVPREFSFSIPSLPLDAELSAVVSLHTLSENDTLGVFIDPEIGIV